MSLISYGSEEAAVFPHLRGPVQGDRDFLGSQTKGVADLRYQLLTQGQGIKVLVVQEAPEAFFRC
jgi:hypothetical protein